MMLVRAGLMNPKLDRFARSTFAVAASVCMGVIIIKVRVGYAAR
jgi:hypothetical protein